MSKKTTEMLNTLKTADSLDAYLRENRDELVSTTVTQELTQLLAESGLTKAQVLQRAEINDIYGYQLFAGTRRPSRDKLIALAIGMGLSLDRTQALLKATGFAPLYAKNRRDSIVIYGIENGSTVLALNTALYDHGEPTL